MTSKLSNDNLRRASLLGLFSVSVLLTLATTPVHAADQAVTDQAGTLPSLKAAPADQSGDAETQVKAITRTIEYTNPETGKDVQVHQVVKYQQKDGKVTPLTDTVWPEYFAPEFKGYQANQVAIRAIQTNGQSKDEIIQVKYYPFDAQAHKVKRPINVFFESVPASSGIAHDCHEIKTVRININPADAIDLPTPPEGWEYVNKNLPAKIRFFNAGGSVLRLRVQKIKPVNEYQEKQQLQRTIIFHLPSGDQSIVQRTVAKRIHGDDKEVSPWIIEPFAKATVPTIDGYTPSMVEVPAYQIPADQLSMPVLPVEISYRATPESGIQTEPKTDSDSQTDSVKTEEAGSQTVLPEAKDETTETVSTGEAGTQTDSISKTNRDSQTDLVKTEEAGSQTVLPEAKDEATGTVSTGEAGTQTESVSRTDSDSQTDLVKTEEAGSQTALPEIKDEATETVSTSEVGTQTDSTSKADHNSQTNQVATNESGTQTGTSETTNLDSQLSNNNQDDPLKIMDKDLTTDTNENNPTNGEVGKGIEALAGQSEVTNNNSFIPLNKATANEQALSEPVDPVVFHNALSPFQDSLKKLGTERVLPQTGNQTNTKTSLAGLLMTLLTALTSLFVLKKRY